MNSDLHYWNAGIPMHRAPLHFASQETRDEWEALSQVNALDVAQKHMTEAQAQNVSGFDLFGSLLQGANSVLAPRNKILDAARADLLKRIQAQLYLAYGFEAPRTLAATPVHIPSAYWRGTVKWEQSELVSQSLRFVEIRLIDHADARLMAAAVQECVAEAATTPPSQPQVKKAGRPSIKQAIADAFEGLRMAGSIDPELSAKSHYPLIRAWLKQSPEHRDIDADALSDEGIRAHFSPLFKSLRKNSKQ